MSFEQIREVLRLDDSRVWLLIALCVALVFTIQSVETAIHEYAPMLIGQDPAGPEAHWHRLYNAWRWRGGCSHGPSRRPVG